MRSFMVVRTIHFKVSTIRFILVKLDSLVQHLSGWKQELEASSIESVIHLPEAVRQVEVGHVQANKRKLVHFDLGLQILHLQSSRLQL